MKWVRFVLAPILFVALVTSSLYVGLARPGAARAFTTKLVSAPEIRAELSTSMVDQLVDSGDVLLKALLTTDRAKAEAAIAESLGKPQEQEEIADAAETAVSAMFTGKKKISIDPKPIFRPVYEALNAVFPALNFGEKNLNELEPIVLGKDDPLPDLSIIRIALMVALFLWPLWFFLVFLYVRRMGRAALRNVSVQTLVVSAMAVLITLIAPLLLRGLVQEPIQKVLVSLAVAHLAATALWISLVLLIAAVTARLLTRERAVPSQSAAEGE